MDECTADECPADECTADECPADECPADEMVEGEHEVEKDDSDAYDYDYVETTIINYTLNNWYIIVTVWLILYIIICNFTTYYIYSNLVVAHGPTFFLLLHVIYIHNMHLYIHTCTLYMGIVYKNFLCGVY